jgi:acyl-CoA reductase-like NAD-dependent aldehyde dehydrogenase
VLGEFSLLDGMPRSASAYAHTEVVARWLSSAALKELCGQQPILGLEVTRALGEHVARKLRHTNRRLAEHLHDDTVDPEIEAMVARAVDAGQHVANWSEARVDALLYDIATAIAERAEELATATVAETGIGHAPDKAIKNRFGSLTVYESLAGRPANGPIRSDMQIGITEIASPMGVVFGLIPMTNPVATLVFKTLITLKGRNALIVSCHRAAQGVGQSAGEIIQTVLEGHGAPRGLVQWVRNRASRKTTNLLMRHPDIAMILATGGVGMVKAAYSSGTPAIGVGPGNAPAWIHGDADPDEAARLVMESKRFDHGIICGSEHHLVVDMAIRAPFLASLERLGAAILSDDEVDRMARLAFDVDTGRLRRDMIGQSADRIAAMIGIARPHPITLIVAPLPLAAITGPWGHEKLAPVLSLFTTEGAASGIDVCRQLLAIEGLGHTAIIHTRDKAVVEHFSLAIDASRILVNMGGSQGCIGLGNGLTPSLTLGCGTYGGTSTTDNVSFTHLLNIKRVARRLAPILDA